MFRVFAKRPSLSFHLSLGFVQTNVPIPLLDSMPCGCSALLGPTSSFDTAFWTEAKHEILLFHFKSHVIKGISKGLTRLLMVLMPIIVFIATFSTF